MESPFEFAKHVSFHFDFLFTVYSKLLASTFKSGFKSPRATPLSPVYPSAIWQLFAFVLKVLEIIARFREERIHKPPRLALLALRAIVRSPVTHGDAD